MTDLIEPTTQAQAEADGSAAEERARKKAPPTPEEQRTAFIRLVSVLAVAAVLTVKTGSTKTVAVVVALITMIMLHELGHYLTAKWGGMKVTEFFVGFGPRLWSVRKGETEYGVKALPLGGYVKIIGMHNLDPVDDPADEPRTYRQQSFGRRLRVAVAGSTMHFLIAFVLFFAVNAIVGVPHPSTTIGVMDAIEGQPSPAQEAGLQVGDKVVAIDGRPIDEWDELRSTIASRPGETTAITVERDGERLDLTATPVDLSTVRIDGKVVTNERRGFLGIGPTDEYRTVDPLTAVGRSAKQWVGGDFDGIEDVSPGLIDNAKALASIASPSGASSLWTNITGGADGKGDPDGVRFLSPVGFTRLAGQAADHGLFEVIGLLIAINLFVGIFNLLPLLPLDGGHVAIAVYEAIRSKVAKRRYTADVAKLMPLTYAVVLLMVFLGVSALYLDIVRPLNFR